MQHTTVFLQIISLVGALLCLFAYIGHQLNWLDSKKVLYNLLNVCGSGILVYIAFRPFQAGFILMEGVWLLVSLYALVKAFGFLSEE